MKKLNITGFIIIALGVLALFVTAVFFHFFVYEEDGKIHGDWRSNESLMYLGTARIISQISGCVIAVGILLFLIGQEKQARKQNITEIFIIILSAAAIIGSLNYFYPCTEVMRMNDRPMRCYWTMKDMLGVMGAVSITGVLMLLFNKSRDFIKGLNCSVITLACLYLLIPSKLTGYCLSVMPCVERYSPFAFMMGSLVLIVAVINAIMLFRGARKKNK